MEAIRKQATKLREQVARQQQAVLKQFGAAGYGGSDYANDGTSFSNIRNLKDYIYQHVLQRDIVRGVEGYIVTGSKQVEMGTKLSEDSRKYGADNTSTSGNTLSKAALSFGRARAQMEKERGNLLKAFGTQVAEPLRAMVMGAPLEDARHLAQRYDRVRQEAEAQAIEVSKRQAKMREGAGNPEMILKLETAESKLHDLKSNMSVLGKEATAAMTAVEAQQQRLTLQRLISMVEAERAYHQRVIQILDLLESEMMSERHRIEASPPTPTVDNSPPPPSYEEANNVFTTPMHNGSSYGLDYFLGEAVYSYRAESDVELNLSTGDYIVVRKKNNDSLTDSPSYRAASFDQQRYFEIISDCKLVVNDLNFLLKPGGEGKWKNITHENELRDIVRLKDESYGQITYTPELWAKTRMAHSLAKTAISLERGVPSFDLDNILETKEWSRLNRVFFCETFDKKDADAKLRGLSTYIGFLKRRQGCAFKEILAKEITLGGEISLEVIPISNGG